MGSETPETPSPLVSVADLVEGRRRADATSGQSLALAIGLAGLVAALLIAIYSR
jgi:hypothetical protein